MVQLKEKQERQIYQQNLSQTLDQFNTISVAENLNEVNKKRNLRSQRKNSANSLRTNIHGAESITTATNNSKTATRPQSSNNYKSMNSNNNLDNSPNDSPRNNNQISLSND